MDALNFQRELLYANIVIWAVPNACHSKVERTFKTGIARASKAIVYIYRALLKPLQR